MKIRKWVLTWSYSGSLHGQVLTRLRWTSPSTQPLRESRQEWIKNEADKALHASLVKSLISIERVKEIWPLPASRLSGCQWMDCLEFGLSTEPPTRPFPQRPKILNISLAILPWSLACSLDFFPGNRAVNEVYDLMASSIPGRWAWARLCNVLIPGSWMDIPLACGARPILP